MKTFSVGPRLVHGEDALDCLKQFAGCRVLVVTDAGLASSSCLDAVMRRLRDAQVTVFDAVVPDPSTQVVAQGLRIYRDAEPYAVVAVGGGSVIDAAKAMHLVALERGKAAEWGLAVVPTTSGSGSEVTSVAVVTDEEQQVKIPQWSWGACCG